MSSLPQRKKTAEEIAELREQLGIPESGGPHAAATIPAEAQSPQPAAGTAPRSEPSIPAAQASLPAPGATPFEPGQAPGPATPRTPKPCRSLRKSEQLPVEPRPAPARGDSPIPARRRSAEEIEEIRRREMLSQMGPATLNPKFRAAHPALITVGYLLAAAGSTIFWRKDFPWTATIAFCATALLVAAYLFARTPVSRHHAGFISLIAALVAVFASLNQFPQLQHAT